MSFIPPFVLYLTPTRGICFPSADVKEMQMDERPPQPREVAVPASVLPALRSALLNEIDALQVTHSFHAAGFSAGTEVCDSFSAKLGGRELTELPRDRFWEALSSSFQRSGWGSLQHRQLHPGLGLLETTDWAEVGDEPGGPEEPGCAFSSGMLAALLGKVAEGPVAVLEVSCRGRGAEACQFAFGAETTVHDLYGFLLDGKSLEDAVASL
jgi:hypothetical protein